MTTTSGYLTFLFTDIEDSARLWDTRPAEMKSALAQHDAILRRIIAVNIGHVFKTVGDAFCAVFSDAGDGLKAALAIQGSFTRAVSPVANNQPLVIKVRVGLHTGEAQFRDNDYFGATVNRVARIMSLGHGGQILMSQSTLECVDQLKAVLDFTIHDCGQHKLKGFLALERIYQVKTPDLPQKFPPLRTSFQHKIDNQGDFIGQSPAMLAHYKDIEDAAQTDFPVYIHGESGTGKELVANALHDYSHRSHLPFIAVNCATIPRELAESELFGHERGSFSGAAETKKGKFELANHGTLFLDEIGDMSLELQPKLLRVLERDEVWRIGGQKPIPIDVRIVTATAANLEERMRERKFRLDLYHRLNVLKIAIPPLRDRGEDIILLANHFLNNYNNQAHKRIDGFTQRAGEALIAWPWPGNVRELENVIARTVIKHSGEGWIDAQDLALPRGSAPFSRSESEPSVGKILSLDEQLAVYERRIVRQALVKNDGHKSKTAAELGITRKRLDRILERHGIVIKKQVEDEDWRL